MNEVESTAGANGVPSIRTVNELFLRVANSKRFDAMLFQDDAEAWKGISSTDVYRRVRAVARAL
jgi:hypothetical protein